MSQEKKPFAQLHKDSTALGRFANWTRLKAAKQALLAAGVVAWRPQVVEALARAAAPEGSAQDIQEAARLVWEQWQADPARQELASALARMMALPAQGEDGLWTLACPLAASALRLDAKSGEVMSLRAQDDWSSEEDESRLSQTFHERLNASKSDRFNWAYPATTTAASLAGQVNPSRWQHEDAALAWKQLQALAKSQTLRALGPAAALIQEVDPHARRPARAGKLLAKARSPLLGLLAQATGSGAGLGSLWAGPQNNGPFAQAMRELVHADGAAGGSPLDPFESMGWDPAWLAPNAREHHLASMARQAREQLAAKQEEPDPREAMARSLLAALSPALDPLTTQVGAPLGASVAIERFKSFTRERLASDKAPLATRASDQAWNFSALAKFFAALKREAEPMLAQAKRQREELKRQEAWGSASMQSLRQAWEGVAKDALGLAAAHEARWLQACGLEEAAKGLSQAKFHEAIGAKLARQEEVALALRQGASPFRVALASVEGSFRAGEGWRALRGAARAKDFESTLGLGDDELSALETSAWSEVFIQCVARSQARGNLNAAAALLALAGFSQLSKQADAIAPARPSQLDSLSKIFDALGGDQRVQSLVAQAEMLSRAADPAFLAARPTAWDELSQALGSVAKAAHFLHRRAIEIERQGRVLGVALVDAGLKKSAADPADKKQRGWTGWEGLPALPLAWPEDEGLARAMEALGGKSAPSDEMAGLLGKEGFAGRMALLAMRAGRSPQIQDGASEQSAINAWLGAGKDAAKAWLGLSEAGWRQARADEDLAKALLGACLPLAAQEERRAKSAEAFKKEPAHAVGAKLLGDFVALALSSGSPMGAAQMAARVSQESLFNQGQLDPSGAYMANAFRCRQHGVSLAKAWEGVALEASACEALRPRWRLALLERAAALSKEADSKAAKPAQDPYEGVALLGANPGPRRSMRKAEQRLAQELAEMGDWAQDWAGRFYSQLPAKLNWKFLQSASRRWHEEAQKQNRDGSSWDPIGIQWRGQGELEGWFAVELTRPAALAEEGKAMRHCVGSYSSHCVNGPSRIVSIRQGERRMGTLQLNSPRASREGVLPVAKHEWQIAQHKAACNAEPSALAKKAAKEIQKMAIAASLEVFEKAQSQGAPKSSAAQEDFQKWDEQADLAPLSGMALRLRAPR